MKSKLLTVTTVILFLLCPCSAARGGCEKFAPSDSIVMDYYHNDAIVRYKAFYRDGVLTRIQGFKNDKRVWFEKHYSENVVDSVVYFSDDGKVFYKVLFRYTPKRRVMMGRQFNTHESIRSRFLGKTDDVTVRTMELYRYGQKDMELISRNEDLVQVLLHSYSGVKKVTGKAAMDSVLRYAYVPHFEEDLTGRPPEEIQPVIMRHREMRDWIAACMSRYPGTKGRIVVEFPIKPDGTVPGVLILESTLPCKNAGIELMNVIKNIVFPASHKYGTATVTYPYQF